jgi:hypothetical protein
MAGLRILFERYVRTEEELQIALADKHATTGIVNCVNGFTISTPIVVPSGCTVDFGWHSFYVTNAITVRKKAHIRNGFFTGAPRLIVREGTAIAPAVIFNIFMQSSAEQETGLLIDAVEPITGGIIQNVSMSNYTNGLLTQNNGYDIKGLVGGGLTFTETTKGITLDTLTTHCKLDALYTPDHTKSLYAALLEGGHNVVSLTVLDGAFHTNSAFSIMTNTDNQVNTNVIPVDMSGTTIAGPSTTGGSVNMSFNPMTGILSF